MSGAAARPLTTHSLVSLVTIVATLPVLVIAIQVVASILPGTVATATRLLPITFTEAPVRCTLCARRRGSLAAFLRALPCSRGLGARVLYL